MKIIKGKINQIKSVGVDRQQISKVNIACNLE